MKYKISEFLVFTNVILMISSTSESSFEFEEDFVHSFLIKPEKLKKSDRLKDMKSDLLEKTGYKNAVAVMVENWTNQKLEFPALTQEKGATDRWYPPQDIPTHTRDIVLVAYSSRGDPENQGTVSFLLEDSWPRLYLVLGWWSKQSNSQGVEVFLSLADKHLNFEKLKAREINGVVMKDKMRFFKGSQHFVAAVTCRKIEESFQLTVSLIPQNLDVWAWEKYYKQDSGVTSTSTQGSTRAQTRVLPTQNIVSSTGGGVVDEETDNEPGVFQRKDLLTAGESVLDFVGNKSERQVLAGLPVSLCVGVRIENWSRYPLTRPAVVTSYGKQTSYLPVTSVGAGNMEFAVLEQDQGATGVSAVIRWHIGDTDTVLSLMVSVPYSLHLWSSWVGVGLTKDQDLPDFSAMYSGTPDSDWFLRQEMGHRLEFSNDDLILLVESDASTAKPVVRLSVLPRKAEEVAKSIHYRLQGKPLPSVPGSRHGREGDKSVLALSSSSAQCHCPCMGLSSHLCIARFLLLFAIGFQFLRNLNICLSV